MDDKHPSTSGEKRKSPCDTKYEYEETQETEQVNSAPQPQGNSAPQPERDSAPQPVLKKMRIRVRYQNIKKIYSPHLENHQENAINPVQLYEETMEVDVETPAKE
ncbi:sperm protein associated with the nucleus on the X chromosome N5-like [Pongo pygmaeus]|uniref:sperm protein associated with the nucleus on the X chromosome N5-like n=1 Tax=Pongo pygmaeus TaxID=9600 RepID=UPI0023E2A906|nr:sperm protein associated with the nucleus on the X chromosome N5-like [Pongo pygmaeus]